MTRPSNIFFAFCLLSALVAHCRSDGEMMLDTSANVTLDLDAFDIHNVINEVFGETRIASTGYVDDNVARLRKELELDKNKTTVEGVKDNVVENPDGAIINGTFSPDSGTTTIKFNVTYIEGEVNYVYCTESPEGKCDKDYALVPDENGKMRICIVPKEAQGQSSEFSDEGEGEQSLAKALIKTFTQRSAKAGPQGEPECFGDNTKIEYVIRTTTDSGKYATKVECKSSDILVMQLIRSMVV